MTKTYCDICGKSFTKGNSYEVPMIKTVEDWTDEGNIFVVDILARKDLDVCCNCEEKLAEKIIELKKEISNNGN